MTKRIKMRKEKAVRMTEQLNEMAEKYPNVAGYRTYKLTTVPSWRLVFIYFLTFFGAGAIAVSIVLFGENYLYRTGLISVLLIVLMLCCIVTFAFSLFGMLLTTFRLGYGQLLVTEFGWFFQKDMDELERTYSVTRDDVTAYLDGLKSTK